MSQEDDQFELTRIKFMFRKFTSEVQNNSANKKSNEVKTSACPEFNIFSWERIAMMSFTIAMKVGKYY